MFGPPRPPANSDTRRQPPNDTTAAGAPPPRPEATPPDAPWPDEGRRLPDAVHPTRVQHVPTRRRLTPF